jgi:predicted RNA-binding Zn-ribbon protein involved in translation (DUF1610 family)
MKPASGPAEANTRVSEPVVIGCGDPLHVRAIQEHWKRCPSCGNTVD